MNDFPVACTLGPEELRARRESLLPGVVAPAAARERIPDGFRWRFESSDHALLGRLAEMVAAEHQCCAFLRFAIRVEPGDGATLLEVTGPPPTPEFLELFVANAAA